LNFILFGCSLTRKKIFSDLLIQGDQRWQRRDQMVSVVGAGPNGIALHLERVQTGQAVQVGQEMNALK